MRLWINNTEITHWIANKGYSDTRNDIEAPDAGRDLSGLMHRGRVDIKKKVQVNIKPLSITDVNTLEALIEPESFSVTITPNNEAKNSTSAISYNMYSNNFTKHYYAFIGGKDWYHEISFPLIEM